MLFTLEQIAAFKKEHGENIVLITVKDKSCILKPPSRKALGYASAVLKTNPIRYNEILLNDAWVAGDEAIKTDNGLFLSVSAKMGDLIEVEEAELVKL